jgi:hypothetical protein
MEEDSLLGEGSEGLDDCGLDRVFLIDEGRVLLETEAALPQIKNPAFDLLIDTTRQSYRISWNLLPAGCVLWYMLCHTCRE